MPVCVVYRFAVDFSQFSVGDFASWNRSSVDLVEESACEQGWVYDTSFYDSSAVITVSNQRQ